MKTISNLFGTSIDDLISDVDVENKKILDEKIAKRFYSEFPQKIIATGFLPKFEVRTAAGKKYG